MADTAIVNEMVGPAIKEPIKAKCEICPMPRKKGVQRKQQRRFGYEQVKTALSTH